MDVSTMRRAARATVYATRRGPQVMAIKAMVDDLLGAAAVETLGE